MSNPNGGQKPNQHGDGKQAGKKVFEISSFGIESAEETRPEFSNLINKAMSRMTKIHGSDFIKGKLFVAGVTLPLDRRNSNNWIVPSENVYESFMKTFVSPYGIPIVHNHTTAPGGFAMDRGDPAPTAGRIINVHISETENAEGKFNAILSGQMIDSPESIDRVMAAKDYTQSVSYKVSAELCSLCGLPMYYGQCKNGHFVGQPVTDEEDKYTGQIPLEAHVPERAIENSFVLVPAFREAVLSAVKMNSATVERPTPNLSLFHYVKSNQWNGYSIGDEEKNNNLKGKILEIEQDKEQELSSGNEKRSIIDTNEAGNAATEENMSKEVLEKLDQNTQILTDLVNKIGQNQQTDTGQGSQSESGGTPSNDGDGSTADKNNGGSGTGEGSDQPKNAELQDVFEACTKTAEIVHQTGLLIHKMHEAFDKQLKELHAEIQNLTEVEDDPDKGNDGNKPSGDAGSGQEPTGEGEPGKGQEKSSEQKDQGKENSQNSPEGGETPSETKNNDTDNQGKGEGSEEQPKKRRISPANQMW